MQTTFPILDSLPVGFRFRPTDEELVNHYLKNKLLGNDYIVNNVLAEVDVCKFEPWELKGLSLIKSNDQEWFFLCHRDYKYANSKKFNRATKLGCWKGTGNERKIKIRGTNEVIGIKKTLVYYYKNGDPGPGVRTNWVIHEYHDDTFEDSKRTFVLSRLIKKAGNKGEEEACTMIYGEGEPSRHMSSDHENQETVEGTSDVINGTLPQMNMESLFQAPHQAEQYFPFLTQQSSISEYEQNLLISNLQHCNAYFENVNTVVQSSFKTPEEEDTFVSSMLTDGDLITGEKRGHVFVNSPVQSESLRLGYCESSGTDADIVSTPWTNVMDTSTHGNVYGSTCFLSFNNGESNYESTFRDDFGGMEASSCDSTADIPLGPDCIESSCSPSTLSRNKNQRHPRRSIIISQRHE